MAGNPTLTPAQLKQILDVNAKSVEIYLEVNNQYEAILKILEKLDSITTDHTSFDEKNLDKLLTMLDTVKTTIKENHEKVVGHNEEITDAMGKIDKAIMKQNIILSGSVASIILAIIAKILFGIG